MNSVFLPSARDQLAQHGISVGEKLPNAGSGSSREAAGQAIGMSGPTFQRVKVCQTIGKPDDGKVASQRATAAGTNRQNIPDAEKIAAQHPEMIIAIENSEKTMPRTSIAPPALH